MKAAIIMQKFCRRLLKRTEKQRAELALLEPPPAVEAAAAAELEEEGTAAAEAEVRLGASAKAEADAVAGADAEVGAVEGAEVRVSTPSAVAEAQRSCERREVEEEARWGAAKAGDGEGVASAMVGRAQMSRSEAAPVESTEDSNAQLPPGSEGRYCATTPRM